MKLFFLNYIRRFIFAAFCAFSRCVSIFFPFFAVYFFAVFFRFCHFLLYFSIFFAISFVFATIRKFSSPLKISNSFLYQFCNNWQHSTIICSISVFPHFCGYSSTQKNIWVYFDNNTSIKFIIKNNAGEL